MKALVTGGAGFIGSNLAVALLRNGNTVTVLDNLDTGFRSNLFSAPGVQFVEGDTRDAAAVRAAMIGCDVVFHLAASVGNKRSIEEPIRDADINVLGTLQILETARKLGVRKIVVSSSAAIFGELQTLPITESHPLDPDTPYGASKLCAEREALAYSKLFGMDIVCLRYFNVYGQHQRYDAYGNVIPIFVFRMLRGEELIILGDGEQTRDFVHVDDVVQANLCAADAAGISGAFNIGSGTRVTINSLIATIQSHGDGPVRVRHAPPRPGDVRHSLADITAARAAIAYNPNVTLVDGIARYVAWARTIASA